MVWLLVIFISRRERPKVILRQTNVGMCWRHLSYQRSFCWRKALFKTPKARLTIHWWSSSSNQVHLIWMIGPSTTTPLAMLTRSLFVFSSTCCLSSWFSKIGTPFLHRLCLLHIPSHLRLEVSNALQHNQSIFVSLAVHMNPTFQSFYMENGSLGWPAPSLKQLFSSAVNYKNKFQKGIISSWEGYNDMSLTITFHSILISKIVQTQFVYLKLYNSTAYVCHI